MKLNFKKIDIEIPVEIPVKFMILTGTGIPANRPILTGTGILPGSRSILGWPFVPKVSVNPLPIPVHTSREVEVLIMSLFYKNNLLNSFLFDLNRNYSPSPLCACGLEEQTTIHLLTNCDYAEENVRDGAILQLNLGNDNLNLVELGTIAALNCSRDPRFVQVCKDIVENDRLDLRTKISLSSPAT